MRESDFSEGMPGRLVPTTNAWTAFVPDPLPPKKLTFGIKTMKLLSQADRAVGQLVGVCEVLPNPHLLIGPFLRREAVLSSKIEGTITKVEQLVLFEAGRTAEGAQTADLHEVANYVMAMEYGLSRLRDFPLSLRFIRELHGKLLDGVRGDEKAPGEFRTIQNAISPVTSDGPRYVPPPAPEMLRCLHEFETFLTRTETLPILIELALLHYQFEAIHPFLDGNGRIGRLLISLLLCYRSVLSRPLLYLSGFFEQHKDEYIDQLLYVSQTGAWVEWIEFFLRAVVQQSEDAISRAKLLLNLRQVFRERMQVARRSALLMTLIDELFAVPALTIQATAKRLKITPRSAQQNIEKLQEAGIIQEMTGQKRNRVYCALEVVRVIDEAITTPAPPREFEATTVLTPNLQV
jgi:Fic family protein